MYIHAYMCAYIHLYVYMCVCVSMLGNIYKEGYGNT